MEKFVLGVLLASFLLAGCTNVFDDGGSTVTPSPVASLSASASVAPSASVVGGDSDEYGCKPSAGYSWCEAKQKCLREWEEECAASAPREEDLPPLPLD